MSTLPQIDVLEQRQLLSDTMEIWTNGGHESDVPMAYIMWIQPAGLSDVCYRVGGCMQDYSWMGDGFQVIESRGVPMVQVPADAKPFVIDAEARKLWSVDEFLQDYPHGLDHIDPQRIPLIDWYNVHTDAATGKKFVMGIDMYRLGPNDVFDPTSTRTSEYGQDGSGPCDQPLGEEPVVCNGDDAQSETPGPTEKPSDSPKLPAAQAQKKHKPQKHHKHHLAKNAAGAAKSLFTNPGQARG